MHTCSKSVSSKWCCWWLMMWLSFSVILAFCQRFVALFTFWGLLHSSTVTVTSVDTVSVISDKCTWSCLTDGGNSVLRASVGGLTAPWRAAGPFFPKTEKETVGQKEKLIKTYYDVCIIYLRESWQHGRSARKSDKCMPALCHPGGSSVGWRLQPKTQLDHML